MNEKLLNEGMAYFKKNLGFHRLFLGIREKYRSLGSMGGSVFLDNLKQEEKESLSGFLGKDYYHQKSASISVKKFKTALANSRFEGISLEIMIEAYFKETLETKKEKEVLAKQKRADFFKACLNDLGDTIAGNWLKTSLEKAESCGHFLEKSYHQNAEMLEKALKKVGKALNKLPVYEKQICRLAIFSTKITDDPHCFDEGGLENKLLTYGIMGIAKKEGSLQMNAEEKAELFYKAGLIKDDVSNYTVTFGLRGIIKEGRAHLGLKGFYDLREPIQLSLWNISQIKTVIAEKNTVFVCENPSVFSGLLDQLKEEKIALICTNGQLRLASILLLDALIFSGNRVFYSGDFDPEGLLIADRLKKRYGENLKLWRFENADYYESLSNKKISASRLEILKNLKTKQLILLSEEIKKIKNAGYQEKLMAYYCEDLRIFLDTFEKTKNKGAFDEIRKINVKKK